MAWFQKLLHTAGLGTVTPPPAGNDITTEASDPLITESGDNVVTE